MAEEVKIKKPIWKRWWFWVIVIFFGLSYLGSKVPPTSKIESKSAQTDVKATPAPEITINYTFDIPLLLGKSVEEVKKELKPYLNKNLEPTSEQIKLGVKDWDVSFTKDDKDLMVSYNIASKTVNDFFIGSDDPSGATNDKKHLLELGNLKENDPRYKVEFVKAFKDPSVYTGVIITPQ